MWNGPAELPLARHSGMHEGRTLSSSADGITDREEAIALIMTQQ